MAGRAIVEYRFTKARARPACWHVPCSPPPQQLSPRHPTSSHHPPCGLFFHPQPILSPHGLDIQILGIPCDLMRRPSQTFDHSTCPIQCGPSAHPANRFHPPPILSPCSLIFEFWGSNPHPHSISGCPCPTFKSSAYPSPVGSHHGLRQLFPPLPTDIKPMRLDFQY